MFQLLTKGAFCDPDYDGVLRTITCSDAKMTWSS